MKSAGLETRITALLASGNATGSFPTSLVCTEQGLLVAAAGDPDPCDVLAALASIFDDVVARVRRDVGMSGVDELTIRDGGRGCFVLRPLAPVSDARMFLIVLVPHSHPWRRTTNQLCARIEAELARSLGEAEARVD